MTDLPIEGAGLNAGAFMAQAANEGLGVVAARTAMREAGLQMSNATFSQMYGEIRAAVAGRDAIAGLNYDAIPGDDAFTTWRVEDGGGYATFVTNYVRVPGQRGVEPRYYTYVTDQPHTPQEAIDAAADHFTNDALTTDTLRGGIYQGSVVTSVTRVTGRI